MNCYPSLIQIELCSLLNLVWGAGELAANAYNSLGGTVFLFSFLGPWNKRALGQEQGSILSMLAKLKEIFVKLLVISICLISERLLFQWIWEKLMVFFVKMYLTCKNADPKILKCGVCLFFNYCFLNVSSSFPCLFFAHRANLQILVQR